MRFTLIHLAHLMGEKLSGFRSAPSGIEFGPGLYARQDYAVGDVIVELTVARKKLEGAMVLLLLLHLKPSAPDRVLPSSCFRVRVLRLMSTPASP